MCPHQTRLSHGCQKWCPQSIISLIFFYSFQDLTVFMLRLGPPGGKVDLHTLQNAQLSFSPARSVLHGWLRWSRCAGPSPGLRGVRMVKCRRASAAILWPSKDERHKVYVHVVYFVHVVLSVCILLFDNVTASVTCKGTQMLNPAW